MHKTIRIIATDLDGTMLHHDNEVSVRNYRAIEHAVNEGMLYVVATGRCRSIVPISNLPVMDYLIAETALSFTGAALSRCCIVRQFLPLSFGRRSELGKSTMPLWNLFQMAEC